MSTADKLEPTAKKGGLKAAMQKLQDKIQGENEKADAMEKEKETVYRNYCKAVGKQQHLKDKVIQTEERIERTEKKIKDNARLVEEKEIFSTESERCNTRLKITSKPTGGGADETAKQVSMYKDMYRKNYEKVQKAKAEKANLEQRYEITERKSKEIQRKLADLKLQVETSLVEEGRRTEGCKQSIDGAFKMEKNCSDLQLYLDAVLKRTEDATKKITKLQSKITKAEDSLEATSFERRTIEATIREVIKEQTGKK